MEVVALFLGSLIEECVVHHLGLMNLQFTCE